MKFYTKYDLPSVKKRKLSENDNVDRLTYLDTTSQIKMFMNAGKNLMLQQKNCVYQSVDDVMMDNSQFSTPVYDCDPVIRAKQMDEMNKSTKDFVAKLKAEDLKRSEAKVKVLPSGDDATNLGAKPSEEHSAE